MFGWDMPAQAKVYTDAADRKRLAAQGMPLIVLPRSEGERGLSHRKVSVVAPQ
jgi:hypothetical protein